VFRERPRRIVLLAAAPVAVAAFAGSGTPSDAAAHAETPRTHTTTVAILMYQELRNPPSRARYLTAVAE
jgi:hypothetical protein